MDSLDSQQAPVVKCINCGSTDVMFSKKRGVYICEDCAFEFAPGEKKQKKRIFISHTENEPIARYLRKDLAADYEIWPETSQGMDKGEHRAKGLDWVEEAGKNGRFIVLMTPESVRRPDGRCLGDISLAVQKKIPIIPIMVSRCDMPLAICRIQRIDLINCMPVEQHAEQYAERLRLIVETIEDEGLDYKNVQSRLLHVLEPLPFDGDIQKHLARFTGRQWILKRVDQWLADPNAARVFWITGAPGVGKTAIAAWLAFHLPEVAAFHLCRYGDTQKSDPRRAIASIAYQLSTQLPEYQDRLNSLNLERIIHEANEKTLFDTLIVQPLSGNFPRPDRAIVVLVDALDEATQEGKNPLSELIASEFRRTPGWLRLIITSRPEFEVTHPLQELTPYKLDTSDPENEQDIRAYLARELRPYTAEREVSKCVDKIASMSEGVFLYVEWIRQELAQKRLSLKRLDEFPLGLTGVYSQFFSRQYPELPRYRDRISPALEILVSAKEPLGMDMVASIFRWDEYERSGFCQELGALFPIADGKLQPFHRSVTEWLTDPDKASGYYIDARNGHIRLSEQGWEEYKKSVNAMTDYMLDHLPAHLISVMRSDDAVAMLTDLTYFNAAWSRNEFTVENYWSELEAKFGIDIVGSYRHIVTDPSKYDGQSAGIARLLYGTGHFAESEVLYDHLAGYFKGINDLRNLKDAYEKKGIILTWYHGDNSRALSIFKEEERICRELGDRFGLQDCLMWQTAPLLNIGDLEGINAIVREMEKNSWSMNKRQIARTLHAKALFLAETGKLDEALVLYREKEKICEEIRDVDCFYMTYNNEALILYEMGDFKESLAVNKKFEKLCLDHGNKYGLAMCLLNFAFVDYDLGKTYEAIGQLKRADEIARKLGHKQTVAQCLGNLAIIYQDTGKPGEAMKLHEEEMEISNEQNDKLGLAYALGNIALIRHDQGSLDEALKLLEEKQKLAEGSSIARSVQAAIGNRALIHFDRDEIDEALRLHKLEEDMCIGLGNKKELAICRLNQANAEYAKGLTDEALRLYEDSEKTFRDMEYLSGTQACLNGKALVLGDRGARDEALKYLQEASDISRRIGNRKGLQSALANQASIHYALGNVEKASQLLAEAEKICAEIDYKEGIAISLMGKAVITAFQDGREEEALKLAHDAVNIVDTCGIWILAKRMHGLEDRIVRDLDSGGAGPNPIQWVVKKQKLDKNS